MYICQEVSLAHCVGRVDVQSHNSGSSPHGCELRSYLHCQGFPYSYLPKKDYICQVNMVVLFSSLACVLWHMVVENCIFVSVYWMLFLNHQVDLFDIIYFFHPMDPGPIPFSFLNDPIFTFQLIFFCFYFPMLLFEGTLSCSFDPYGETNGKRCLQCFQTDGNTAYFVSLYLQLPLEMNSYPQLLFYFV